MFSPVQPPPASPKFADTLGRSRQRHSASDQSNDGEPSEFNHLGAPSGPVRQVDLRAILKTSRLEESLFSLAFITTHDNDLPPNLSWLFLIIEDVQWLSFPFSSYLHHDIPSWINVVLDPIRSVPDYSSFVVANIITLLLVFSVVILTGIVILAMHKRGKVPILALRVLRLLSALIMSALSIPIASFFTMGVHCPDGRLPKWGSECYTAPHLPLYVFNILGLIAFVPLLVLGVILFIETNPSSKSPIARAHSRTDVHDVIVRLMLAMGDVVLYKSSEGFQWVFMAGGTVMLAYLSWQKSRTQPYYNLTTTAFRSGMCMSTAMGLLCSMFVRGLVGYETNGHWILLVPASIVGFLIGAALAYGYNRQFLKRIVRTWHRILREEETHQAATRSELSLTSSSPGHHPTTMQPLGNNGVHNGTSTVQSQLGTDQKESTSTTPPKTRPVSPPTAAIVRSAPMTPTPSVMSQRPNSSPLKNEISISTNTNDSHDSLPIAQSASVKATSEAAPSLTETQSPLAAIPAAAVSPATPTRAAPVVTRTTRAKSISHSPTAHTFRETFALDSSGSLSIHQSHHHPHAPKKTPSNSKLHIPTVEESEKVITTVLQGTSLDALNAVRERRPRRRQNVFDSPLEVEVCVRFIRENPTEKQITIGLHLLERGLLEFPSDPMLLLLAATYLSTYYGQEGEKIAEGLMKELESSRQVPLDVKFLGYCRERSLKSAGAHVLDKVALDSLDHESRYHHLRAMYALRDAWECIRINATAERLAEVTARLAFHRTRASSCYTRLLARSARDKNSLRLFAQYLGTVENDVLRAQQIVNLADDVEAREEATHMHALTQNQNLVDSSEERISCHSPTFLQLEGRRDSAPSSGKECDETLPPSPVANDDAAATFFTPGSPPPQFSSQPPPTLATTFNDNAVFARVMANAYTSQVPRPSSQHGSQTSGTSVSRVHRQRASMRHVMQTRLARPLKDIWLTGVFVVIFIACLVAGVIVCLNFMTMSSDAIGIQFSAARDGRKAMLRIVESFRKMTYGASANSTAEYQSGYSLMAMHYKEMVETVLPIINTMDAGDHEARPHYRPFNRVIINASRTDYVPSTLTAIELANTVVQTSALALNYKTPGSLTAQVVASIPEFRFLVDNLFILMEASKELPKTGIRVYHELVDSVEIYLIIGMIVCFVILFAVVVTIYLRVTKAYFSRESKVHSLLLSVPKKMAATMVTDMEEEIETFREVVQSDDGQELDLSLVDHHETVGLAGLEDNVAAASLGTAASGGTSSGHGSKRMVSASGWGKSPRRAKFFIPIFACVALISVMIGSLFAMTYRGLDVDNDMDHFLLVADLRFHGRALRMCGREFVSPDHTVPDALLIQYFRASLLESEAILDKVLDEANGLTHKIPHLTVLPRNCTLPNVCPGLPLDAPAIGFTQEIASASFVTEYRRMIDMGGHLVEYFLDSNARQSIRSMPDAFNLWLLVEAVCEDLVARCNEVEKAIQANLLSQLASAKSGILVAFVLLILLSVTSFGLFIYYGTNKLQRESEALILLLHMVPLNMLKDKEMTELARFMESAGLTLLV